MAERGMVEVDFAADRERLGRRDADVAILIAETDRLQNLDRLPGSALLDDAGTLDEEDERRGAPVHDGNLLAIQLDHRVVDAASGEGGHQVLDGPHRDMAVADGGAQPGIDDVAVDGLDRAAGAGRLVGAAEDDAGAGRRRAQLHAHLAVAVYADTGTVNGRFEGLLRSHRSTHASCPMAIHTGSLPLASPGAPRRAARLPTGPDEPLGESAIEVATILANAPQAGKSLFVTSCYGLFSLVQLAGCRLSWPGGGETPGCRAGPPCRRAPGWRARTRRGRARAISPRPPPAPV